MMDDPLGLFLFHLLTQHKYFSWNPSPIYFISGNAVPQTHIFWHSNGYIGAISEYFFQDSHAWFLGMFFSCNPTGPHSNPQHIFNHETSAPNAYFWQSGGYIGALSAYFIRAPYAGPPCIIFRNLTYIFLGQPPPPVHFFVEPNPTF